MTEEEIHEMVDRVFDLKFYVRTWGPMWWDEWHRRMADGPARTELQRLIFRGKSTSFGATHRTPGILRWRRVLKCVLKHPALRSIVDEGWRSFQRVEIRHFRALDGKRAPELMREEGGRLHENVKKVLTGFGRIDEAHADFILEEPKEGILWVQVYSLSSLKKEVAFRIQDLLHGLKNRWCVVIKPQIEDAAFLGRHFDIEIYANRMEEFWDINHLRDRLGDRFEW